MDVIAFLWPTWEDDQSEPRPPVFEARGYRLLAVPEYISTFDST